MVLDQLIETPGVIAGEEGLGPGGTLATLAACYTILHYTSCLLYYTILHYTSCLPLLLLALAAYSKLSQDSLVGVAHMAARSCRREAEENLGGGGLMPSFLYAMLGMTFSCFGPVFLFFLRFRPPPPLPNFGFINLMEWLFLVQCKFPEILKLRKYIFFVC